MHSTLAIALASGLASSALAAPAVVASKPDLFTAIAAHSASPIHLSSLYAHGNSFYVGAASSTTTYCPDVVAAQGGCPAGTSTVFGYGNGGISLDTAVPGGQQIYINPAGALSFTQAHSGAVPQGSVSDGWTHELPVAGGNDLGTLSHSGAFLACEEDGAYRVYVDAAGFDAAAHTGCIGFEALTSNYTAGGAAVWQYI